MRKHTGVKVNKSLHKGPFKSYFTVDLERLRMTYSLSFLGFPTHYLKLSSKHFSEHYHHFHIKDGEIRKSLGAGVLSDLCQVTQLASCRGKV